MDKTAQAAVGLAAAMLGVFEPAVATLGAQVPPQGGVVRINRTQRPPAIEDFVSGDPPNATLTIVDFRQFELGDGVPVGDSTLAYLSFDDANLFFVFVFRCDSRLVLACF